MSEWQEAGTAPANDEWTEVGDSLFAKFKDPGDSAEGVVLSYDAQRGATTFDGDDCGSVLLQTDNGNLMVSLDKKALADRVAAANPREGDLLRILFSEWKESRHGNQYKNFRVFTKRGGGSAAPSSPTVALNTPVGPGAGGRGAEKFSGAQPF